MKELLDLFIIIDYYKLRSCRKVAELYNCCDETIRRTLKRNNIKLTEWKQMPEHRLPKKKYPSKARRYIPVEYEKVCEYCGKPFIAHNKGKRFCSKKCKDISIKLKKGISCNPNMEPFKKICIICGKEFETYREATLCCSSECSKGYHKRPERDPRTKYTWDEYIAKRRAEAEERRAQKAKLKNLWNLLQIIEEKVDKECEICGEIFHSKYQTQKRCANCQRYFRNRRKDKRIPKDRIIDKDITLKKLFKRDGGKCWICGGDCNWNDTFINDLGNKRYGPTYPSKDHVIPIARGGFESWNNVRLAHLKCNEEKSANIYPYLPMDKEFAYSYKGHGTQPKKTAQYTLDGELVKIWPSTASIRKELGLNDKHIQSVCRGYKSNTGNAYGYHWEYLEEA